MERPASVTAFGILNIVFGVLGVFGLPGTIALFSLTDLSALQRRSAPHRSADCPVCCFASDTDRQGCLRYNGAAFTV